MSDECCNDNLSCKDSFEDLQNVNKELTNTNKELNEKIELYTKSIIDLKKYINSVKQDMEKEKESFQKKTITNLIKYLEQINLFIKNINNSQALSEALKNTSDVILFDLSSFSVRKIEVNVGDKFDPKIHFATGSIEGNDSQKNTIAEVNDAAFIQGDKVIKLASVVVYK